MLSRKQILEMFWIVEISTLYDDVAIKPFNTREQAMDALVMLSYQHPMRRYLIKKGSQLK